MNDNILLAKLDESMCRLQRILLSHGPGQQGEHQDQFDALMRRLEEAHSLARKRGFIVTRAD